MCRSSIWVRFLPRESCTASNTLNQSIVPDVIGTFDHALPSNDTLVIGNCCCSCSFSLSRWTAAISNTQAIATRGPQCTCWSWALPEEWLLPCRSSKAWARLWVSWACRSSCTAGWQAGRPAFTLPCLMGGTNLLPRAWLSCWGVWQLPRLSSWGLVEWHYIEN